MSEDKRQEWRLRAAKKEAVVPHFFEVFPTAVELECGGCRTRFKRALVPNVNEPVFVCPNEQCRARNWVPIRYELR